MLFFPELNGKTLLNDKTFSLTWSKKKKNSSLDQRPYTKTQTIRTAHAWKAFLSHQAIYTHVAHEHIYTA